MTVAPCDAWTEPACFQCAKGKKAPLQLCGKAAETVFLFVPFYKHGVDVRCDAVRQCPAESKSITRPVLCDNYRPGDAASCPKGRRCHFYHADCDWRSLEPSAAHVRFAYPAAEECEQRRRGCGEVTVYSEDANVAECVPVSEFMETAAVLTPSTVVVPAGSACCGDVAYVCHMYEHHGICSLGRECPNVHRIVVDASVQCGERRWAKPVRAVHTRSMPVRGAGAGAAACGVHPFYAESCVRVRTDGRVTWNAVVPPVAVPAEGSADCLGE